jgi:Cof subfamily protein (haloacid dehalogenase superfamily)
MKNIRLVVTDMDGCLLHDDKSMPKDLFEVIDDCYNNDIQFAIASGRSYFDLKKQFENKLNKIILICDNGALIYNKGEIIFRNQIKHNEIFDLVEKLRSLRGSIPIYVTETESFIEKNTYMEKQALDLIHKYYSEYKIIDNIKLLNEDIFKITVCHSSGTGQNTLPYLNDFLSSYKVVVSGYNWLDISNLNVNKGNGVKHIREILDVNNEHTVVFGDYLNDIEMFQVSDNAFAVSNANPEIIKLASRIIGSNQEDGVTSTIKEIINDKVKNKSN